MAHGVDMPGDALVCGLGLHALPRSHRWKGGAAPAKGLFILAFGIGILIDVGAKMRAGAPPSSTLMLVLGSIALTANLLCLSLPWRLRAQDVNRASTFECSRNDVVSNVGMLAAAARSRSLGRPGRIFRSAASLPSCSCARPCA